jgi:hypothetical protein
MSQRRLERAERRAERRARRRERRDVLGLVNAGLILILVSVLLLIVFVPFDQIALQWAAFFSDIKPYVVPSNGFLVFYLEHWNTHLQVYLFIYMFFLGTVAISVIVLILRVIFKDTYRRQVESASGVIWSAGMAWAAYQLLAIPDFLLSTFGGYLIVFAGLSLITSSLAYFAVQRYGP